MTKEEKAAYIISLLQNDSMILKLIRARATMIIPMMDEIKLDEIITILNN